MSKFVGSKFSKYQLNWNIPDIFFTFLVLKLDTFNSLIPPQPLNIKDISVTSSVVKPATFNSDNLLQFKNIKDISFALLVLKFLTSNFCTFWQFRNIFEKVWHSEVSKPDTSRLVKLLQSVNI